MGVVFTYVIPVFVIVIQALRQGRVIDQTLRAKQTGIAL